MSKTDGSGRGHRASVTPSAAAAGAVGAGIAAFLLLVYLVPSARLGFWEPWETSLATLGRHVATTDGVSAFAPLRDGELVGKPWLQTWLLAVGYKLGGGSELGFRAPLAALNAAAAVYAFAVFAPLFGLWRAAASALLFGILPLMLLSGSSLAGDAPFIAVLTATLLTAGVACTAPERRPWAMPLLGLLLAGCVWGHGVIGLGLALAVLALFAVGARDEHGADSTLLPMLAGGLVVLGSVGVPVALAMSLGWDEAKDLVGVGAALGLPAGLLLAAAPNSHARPLFHPLWSTVAGLVFLAAVAPPFVALLGVTDVEGAVRHLLYDTHLTERVFPGHVTFDVLIRLVGGSAFPAIMFVPFGFAYLFRTYDAPDDETDDPSEPARVFKQLLGVWMAAGFLVAGMAISLSGHVTFAVGLPIAASVALSLGDGRYRRALSENRSVLYLAGLATLFLLMVTVKDLRGTYDLELGRPGPHVLFEPLLTDGKVEFPKTYALANIKLFFVAWALIALLAFSEPLANAVRAASVVSGWRLVPRFVAGPLTRFAAWIDTTGRRVTRGAAPGTLTLGALLASMAAWSLNLAFVDLPAVTHHFSQKGLLQTYERLAGDGVPLHAVGINANDNSYYLGGDGVLRLDSVNDVRALFCDTSTRQFVVVPFASLAGAHAATRRADADAGEADCPNGAPFYVVDGRSTRYVLATNQLDAAAGEEDQSVIGRNVFTLDTLPETAVRVDREIIGGDGELRLVAYEIDPPSIDSGDVNVVAYWEVLKTPSADWEVFIHVDFRGNRLNGDHKPVGGHYPTRDWVVGEVIRDSHPVKVSRADRAGEYTVYYGFFRGDDRMTIAGAESDNRLRLDSLQVQ